MLRGEDVEAAGRRHHQQPKERPEQKPPATGESPEQNLPRAYGGSQALPGSSWVLALTSRTVREEVFVKTPALWCYLLAALGSQRRDEYDSSI